MVGVRKITFDPSCPKTVWVEIDKENPFKLGYMVTLTVPLLDVCLNDAICHCAFDLFPDHPVEMQIDYQEHPTQRDTVLWARFTSKSCPATPEGPKQHTPAKEKDGREPVTEPLGPKAPQLTAEKEPHKQAAEHLPEKSQGTK